MGVDLDNDTRECLERDGLSLIEWAPLRSFTKSENKITAIRRIHTVGIFQGGFFSDLCNFSSTLMAD